MRLLFAGVSAFALASVMLTAAPDTVTIDGGRVSGIVTDGVNTYRGIPYAAPPVGELRWKPPAPLVPWQGVRDGRTTPPSVRKHNIRTGPFTSGRSRPERGLPVPERLDHREGRDKRPVFVWVHGGALTHGSSTSDVRDGRRSRRRTSWWCRSTIVLGRWATWRTRS
jgi:para-nitrobenzyl esterase